MTKHAGGFIGVVMSDSQHFNVLKGCAVTFIPEKVESFETDM